MTDKRDMSAQFNTALTPEEEQRFQRWVKDSHKERDLFDYDLRGAWKADTKAAANGHLPDTWKKPNHPTFSAESQYSNDQTPGGKWVEKNGRWTFTPSDFNIKNLGVDGLREYFKRREPDVDLLLPSLQQGGNMNYRPIMNPIDVPDARRQPVMQPQTQAQGVDRQKVMQALMNPAQSSMIFGRNFEGMFNPPIQQQQQQQMQPMPQPQNMGQGMAQMGEAFAHRQRQKQGAFPKAPGNNPMSGFGRLMGLFGNKGLY